MPSGKTAAVVLEPRSAGERQTQRDRSRPFSRCAEAPTARNEAHHLIVDVGEYLLSLNLPFAMAVGGVLIVVGLVLLRFLMATTSEVGRMVPGAGGAAGRAILDTRGLPENSWVCTNCRSVNTPQSTHCYRGCGPREQLAEPLPEDRSLLADRQNGKRVL